MSILFFIVITIFFGKVFSRFALALFTQFSVFMIIFILGILLIRALLMAVLIF